MAETPTETNEERTTETAPTPAGPPGSRGPGVRPGNRSLPPRLAALVQRVGLGRTAPSPTSGRGGPEPAIQIDDRISGVFVGGAIALYVAIFAYAVLFGSGGVFTPLPTPTPRPSPTAVPSAAASASPAPSPLASPAPTTTTPSPSRTPSAGGAASGPAGSASPARPTPGPSAAATTAPTPVASPSAAIAPAANAPAAETSDVSSPGSGRPGGPLC
jgi:hypothetical protein